MSTSLAQLREKVNRRMGDHREGTADTNATATSVIDTELADRPNDYYNTWYVKCVTSTDGLAPQGEVRKVSDFAQSGGVLTVSAAFSAAVTASDTYELSRITPDDKDTIIKEALRQIYPDLHKPVIDESLISGNHLRDGSFEEWSSASVITYFTENSNMTPAQESTTKRFGSYSMKLTSGAATAYRGQSNSNVPELLDLGGQVVTFKAWCNASDASHARLHIYTLDDDGTAQNLYSDYHTGSGRWELLVLEDQSLNKNIRTIAFRFHGDVNAKIAYWDYARVTGPNVSRYYLPPTIERLAQVKLQSNANTEGDEDPCDDLGETGPFIELLGWLMGDDGTSRYIYIPYSQETGRKLRLVGTTYLTQPASDSATTELNEPQSDVICAYVISMLYSQNFGTLPADEIGRAQPLAQFWQGEYGRLLRQHRMIAPSKPFPAVT